MQPKQTMNDKRLVPAFLTLIENSVDLMSILGLDGRNIYINKAGRQILGIAADADVSLIPISDFHTPEQIAFVETEILANVMKYGRWSGEFAIKNVSTGEIIPMYNNCHRIDSPETGEVIAVGAVMRDLRPDFAVRQELEERIREGRADLTLRNQELLKSEERYHKMIEEVEDYAILLLDSKGNIQNWNRGAERIKGYRSDEIIGTNFRIFYLPDDQQDGLPERLIREATEKGKALHEGWRVRKNGTHFWGSVTITALHNDKNDVIGFSKVTRDLTDKKRAEERIMQYTKDLEFQNQELEQFAYAAAHDMKEPLRKIRFYNNYLSEAFGDTIPEKTKEYLSRSISAATRMQGLIDDLLKYSQASSQSRNLEKIDLQEVVTQVIQQHSENIQQTEAIIETAGLPIIDGVRFQMRQLFDNLVVNSLKYRHPGRLPRISIYASETKGSEIPNETVDKNAVFIKVVVSDNGIGFEQESKHKIFDLFERLDSGMNFSGSGIGLAICKKIMQNHHGYIFASGETGKGASFTMYFPAEPTNRP